MVKHKNGKRVKGSEEREVEGLLSQGKGVPAVVRETGISRSKVYDLRKLFLAKAAERAEKSPGNPIQEQAWAMCRLGDHDWMTSVMGMQRYKDQAFSEKVILEPTDAEGMVTVRHIKTCYRCHHQEQWSTRDSETMLQILG